MGAAPLIKKSAVPYKGFIIETKINITARYFCCCCKYGDPIVIHVLCIEGYHDPYK